MSRLFTEHIKREVTNLDGVWNFKTDPNNLGKDEKWFEGINEPEISAVPSVWNKERGLLDYKGHAWYQRQFHTNGGTLRLKFEAVMTEADVWFDDQYLGYHYGGFCEFDFIVNDVDAGFHTLTVCVNNKPDAQSIPMSAVDWHHDGGIVRSVWAETLKGICVINNRFDYTLSEDLKTATGYFTLDLYNAENTDVTSKIEIKIGEDNVYADTVTLKAGERKVVTTPEFILKDIRLWDIGKPELYDIAITTETDDLYDRTGFRLVEVKDNKILLNGRKIEFRGVNRHEEYPDFGFAFPVSLMRRDLDIIEDLGCNSIRGSHYPNSKIFVDMLDARGILFWSEIPIWGCGFSEEALGDPVVVERGLEMHKEMLKYYFNHPSIVIWGMHNEIKVATQNAYDMSKKYYEFLKENGGNRIVTYATANPMEDICLEFCDVICINQYYGWYSGEKHDWEGFLEKFRERRESLGFSQKPVIMSEFGIAALYGHHTFDNIRWTEEYQADILSHCVNLFHKDPMMSGFFIWQFTDMRTQSAWAISRARGFNNKGILNEHRKPKAAYFAIKKDYHEFAKDDE